MISYFGSKAKCNTKPVNWKILLSLWVVSTWNQNCRFQIIYPNLISEELSGLCHQLMDSYQLSVKHVPSLINVTLSDLDQLY